MTVQQIADLILSADPEAKHYDATAAANAGVDFTVWMEYERTGLDAEDAWAEKGWRFEVDRYTKTEFDPVADLLEDVLSTAEGVTCGHRVLYDISNGYIRHVFDCEGI